MIRGLHGLFYTSEPEAMRAFLRDRMRLPWTDVGEGWLIFDLPEADVGVHPTEGSEGTPSGTHDVSFWCDDIRGTVADLKARGVEFTGEIEDRGYGMVTYFTMPGGVEVQLYEPRYRKATGQARPAGRQPRATRKARRISRPGAGKKVGRVARKGGQVKKPRR
ncbi:MAG: VOC family protein [Myxococcales bacterium]